MDDIQVGAIYKHLPTGNLYKVMMVAAHNDKISNHSKLADRVIYYRCNEQGIFVSIRDDGGNITARQPFHRSMIEFSLRFKLYSNGKKT